MRGKKKQMASSRHCSSTKIDRICRFYFLLSSLWVSSPQIGLPFTSSERKRAKVSELSRSKNPLFLLPLFYWMSLDRWMHCFSCWDKALLVWSWREVSHLLWKVWSGKRGRRWRGKVRAMKAKIEDGGGRRRQHFTLMWGERKRNTERERDNTERSRAKWQEMKQNESRDTLVVSDQWNNRLHWRRNDVYDR